MPKWLNKEVLWDEVYNWATNNSYSFDHPGSGKAANHPVHTVNWYDCAKWCNARSEMEGRTPCYNLGDWSCDFTLVESPRSFDGLEPRETGWQLEQQRQELPFGEPQQEQSGEHEQQHRVPLRSACQYRGRDSG